MSVRTRIRRGLLRYRRYRVSARARQLIAAGRQSQLTRVGIVGLSLIVALQSFVVLERGAQAEELFTSDTVAARVVGNNSASGNGPKLAVSNPTEPADVLIAQVIREDTNTDEDVTAPDGWSDVRIDVADGGLAQAIYWAPATVDPKQTWRFRGGAETTISVLAIDGVDVVDPILDSAGEASMGGPAQMPGVEVGDGGDLVLSLVAGLGSGQWSSPASDLVAGHVEGPFAVSAFVRNTTVTGTADSDDVASAVGATIVVRRAVEPLLAEAGGPYQLDAGESLAVDASGSTGREVSFVWMRGEAEVATSVNPTIPWAAIDGTEETFELTLIASAGDLRCRSTFSPMVKSRMSSSLQTPNR